MDDITPLQQLSDDVLAKNEHVFRPRPAILWDEDKQAWHGGGDEMFRAKNPPDAILSYYLKTAADGAVKLQVANASGTVVRELDGPRGAGIHRVAWNLRKRVERSQPVSAIATVTAAKVAVRPFVDARREALAIISPPAATVALSMA